MALSEYEKKVGESLKEQGASSSEFKEWLNKSRASKQLDDSLEVSQSTREKMFKETENRLLSGGVKEEEEESTTTTLPKETEKGIRKEITEEPGISKAGAGLGTLVGLEKEETGLMGKIGEGLTGLEETVSGGIESTLSGIKGGVENIQEGVTDIFSKAGPTIANKLRGMLGKDLLTEEEAKDSFNIDTSIQEDLLNIGQGSLATGLTAAFPYTTVLLNTAAETSGGQKVLLPLSNAMEVGGNLVNKLPVLKEFRENLPEDQRSDFDAFTAQVLSLGLAKTVSEILKRYNSQKIIKLNKEAEGLVNEFIKPTKETTKQITKQITPEILERKITGTREQVLEQAKTGIKTTGKEIENFIKEGKVKGEMPIDKLVDTLAKEDATLRFEGKILPGKEPQVKFINDTLDFLEKIQKDSGNTLSPNAQITLKRAFDTVFDKTVTRDKIVKFQDDLQVKLADTLRNELSKNNPNFAEINKDFSFYKNLETVMEQTDLRTTGQSGGLGNLIAGGQKGTAGGVVGATAGGVIAGPTGAVVGGILGGALGTKLQSIISSPKFKLLSANKKYNLSKTLSSGNTAKIETLLNTLAIEVGAVQQSKKKTALDILPKN